MEAEKQKVPGWFWVVSIIALIWNIMGVMQYLALSFMTPEQMATLPQEQQDLISSTPAWATAAFAFAVWAGLLGCILLLVRKKIAKQLFIISLIGIIVQLINNLFLSEAVSVYGTQAMVLPILVLGFGIFLIWFSNKGIARNWLK